MRTASNRVAFPQREQRENNPFPKEKQFSGLFFLDANIANALLIMSLIMKNLFHRNFKGKVKKDCGKMQGKTGKCFGTLAFVPKNGLFQDKIISQLLCNLLIVK
jgi:hypothetical protein